MSVFMVNAREFEKMWTKERTRVERFSRQDSKFWNAWRLEQLEKHRASVSPKQAT